MIFDKISNWKNYFQSNAAWKKTFEFIQKASDLEGGFEIDGRNIYASVSCIATREADSIFEAHRDYADIHIRLAGEETIYSTCINDDMTVNTPYDKEKDFILFEGIQSPDTEVIIRPGYFALYLPDDVHKPCVMTGDSPVNTKKIIVKIKASLLCESANF